MDRDSLSASFLDCGLYKQVVRKGHSENGTGDIRMLRRGPTFVVSHQKERDVHTETSTAVLFIRGADLETTSEGPVAGGGDYSEPLRGASPGAGAARRGAEAWAWLVQRLCHQRGRCPQLRL